MGNKQSHAATRALRVAALAAVQSLIFPPKSSENSPCLAVVVARIRQLSSSPCWGCDSSTVALVAASPVVRCDWTSKLDKSVKQQGSNCPLSRRHGASRAPCRQSPSPVVPASTFACAPSTFNRKTTASIPPQHTRISTLARAVPGPSHQLTSERKVQVQVHVPSTRSTSPCPTLSHLGQPQARRETTTRLPHQGTCTRPNLTATAKAKQPDLTLEPSSGQTTKPHSPRPLHQPQPTWLPYSPSLSSSNTSLIASPRRHVAIRTVAIRRR